MAEGLEPYHLNYSDFVIETHTLRNSATLAANANLEIVGETLTKTGGWYPICISGFSYTGWATQYVYPFSMRIGDQQVGSASLIFRLKNTYDAEITIGYVTVYVLWVRVN